MTKIRYCKLLLAAAFLIIGANFVMGGVISIDPVTGVFVRSEYSSGATPSTSLLSSTAITVERERR